MKNKFVLTEEESKRILSLHKKKIAEERQQVDEVDTDLGGWTAAGAGAGALAGAGIGSFIPGVGTAVGAVIGAVGGTIVGYTLNADGAPRSVVKGILTKCRTDRKKFTKPTKSPARLQTIAGDMRAAFSTWGWTNLEDLRRAINSCDNIVDFCNVSYVYQNTFQESLWSALDGDLDANEEWSTYVLKPLQKIAKKTQVIDDSELLSKAKKCGYSSVSEYKSANWKCPKSGKKTLTDDEKLKKAKNCGHSSWDEYKNSGWKCDVKSKDNFGGGGKEKDNKDELDFDDESDILNPFGQGREEIEKISITDKVYSEL